MMRIYGYLSLLGICSGLWAQLPVSFTSAPDLSKVAIGQINSLNYIIRNNVQTQSLPIKSIKIVNDGDSQPRAVTALNTTCGSMLAPNATCAISVAINNPQEQLKRHLAIDYNGRAPLTSAINIAKAKYTILVYMVGSNLERTDALATQNIQQMMAVGSTNNINIILETGGANKIGWLTVQRKIVLPHAVSLIKDLGALSMGSPQVVEDFFQWGVNNYPADHYLAILWDHGGGPNGGFGGDELRLPKETQINELSQVFQNVTTATGKKFEIIGFDACFMGNAETYSALYPYTNYLLGSEDLEPGGGWQYNTFLQYINTHLTASATDIGTEIINGYTEQNKDEATTLSLVDATKIPALLLSITQFGSQLNHYVNTIENWKNIARRRFKAFDYGTSVWDNTSFDVVDLYEFVQTISAQFPLDASLALAANTVKSEIKEAVVYQKNSFNRQLSHGLTVYFPSILPQYSIDYPDKTMLHGVEFFSAAFVNLVVNYYQFYNNNKNSLTANPINLTYNNPTYAATVSNDFETAYAAVGNNLCTNLSNDNGFMYPDGPCYTSLQYKTVAATPLNPMWHIEFNNSSYASSWPLLNGTPVLFIPDETDNSQQPNYQGTFLVPVGYVGSTSGGYLNILINSNNEYNVVGFQSTSGGFNTAGKILDIEDGQEFYIKTYTEQNGQWVLARTTTKITAPFELTFGPVNNVFDAFRFIVADLTGHYMSHPLQNPMLK